MSASQPKPTNTVAAPSKSKGPAIAALVVGILAFLTSWIPVFGGVLALVAIVLGGIGLSKGQGGMAIAGLVLGVIAILFNIFVTIGAVAYFGVVSPDNFVPEQCSISNADWDCNDFIYEGSEVRFQLENSAGIELSNAVLTANDECFGDIRQELGTIAAGDRARVTVNYCEGQSIANFDFSISYEESNRAAGEILVQNVG